MDFTLDDIRNALNAAPASISKAGVIASGKLKVSTGEVEYNIHLGWDLIIANLCDRTWGVFNMTLMRHIRKLELSGVDVTQILEDAQLDDSHWRWLDKSLHYRGDCFKWFFLVAEDYPQAACLIFHPKSSVVGAGNIFYIEYIAAAPWNRENAMQDRVFKGVGPLLLDTVIAHAKDKLGLNPGFSLHSLPKATKFYNKIGMTPFPAHDKDGLEFFEWVQK